MTSASPPSLLLRLSLAANVILAAFLLAGILASFSASSTSGTARPPSVSAPTARKIPALTPAIWSGLLDASKADNNDDLKTLAARLRAAGFPPDAILAVVRAELHERFRPRRNAIRLPEVTKPYWRQRDWLLSGTDPATHDARRALDREEHRQLRAILGADAELDPTSETSEFRRTMPGLGEDKIRAAGALLSAYQEHLEDQPDVLLPGDRARQLAYQRDLHAQLAAVLSPSELEAYDLRASDTAESLRDDLSAFHASEQEFRTLFHLRQEFDLAWGYADYQTTAEQRQARTAAEDQLDNQIKAALGPDRYADYQRATDSGYQQTSTLAARLNLPDRTADDISSLQSDIDARVARALIHRDATTPATFAALHDEAVTRLTALLGPAGYQAYRDLPASVWLNHLETSRP